MAEDAPLPDDVLTQVIYGMENQRKRFVFRPETGEVLPVESGADGLPLPEWKSADGFQLMERFAAALPDPVLRGGLEAALSSGSGVFRQFKDALAGHPGHEALWRRFKRREMAKVAYSWFARLSDAAGLEALGIEPEDLDDLPLTDFTVRPYDAGDRDAVAAWDAGYLAEAFPNRPAAEAEALDAIERGGRAMGDGVAAVAEDAGGGIVGYAWAAIEPWDGGATAKFLRLFVSPGFRGLGLAARLVAEALRSARDAGATSATAVTGGGGRRIEALLEREGFVREAVVWRLKG